MEPMLSRPSREYIDTLSQYVSDSIWIGPMTSVSQIQNLEDIEDTVVDKVLGINEHIHEIIAELRSNPKVFWKTHAMKEALGIK